MTQKHSFERRVRKTMAQFGPEVDEKMTTTIVKSITSDRDLRTLTRKFRAKLKEQLISAVDQCLNQHAHESSSNMAFWALAMITVEDNQVAPVSDRARALARILKLPLHVVAAEVLANHWEQAEFYLEPYDHHGNLYLSLSCPSMSDTRRAQLSSIAADNMHCGDFWIALCREVISSLKRASGRPKLRIIGKKGRGQKSNSRNGNRKGTQLSLRCSGSAQSWMNLMQQLIVHPVVLDEQAQ